MSSVLSGNRNFEGRVNPLTRANYLASPMLVVVYALAGSMKIDITKDPIGIGKGGKPVYLKDIWPSNMEVSKTVDKFVTAKAFKKRYANVFEGDRFWRGIKTKPSLTYAWDDKSTYVRNPPYFEGMGKTPAALTNITGARPLGQFGDSITTDHISPAGSIKKDSPAGKYLMEEGVEAKDFNQYGTRRGNHEVMMRGTFANIRLKNEMVPGIEGGFTHHYTTDQPEPIYDVAMRYKKEHTPQVLIAGKEYGTGSSRDWAAKGVNLLSVKAVVCETFERIHRSNLVGMGVLPLQFKDGMTRKTLNLTGRETYDVGGIDGELKPGMDVPLTIHRPDGASGDHHADLPHRYRGRGRLLQERRRAALRAAQPGPRGLTPKDTGPMATGLPGHAVAMARNNIWANHRLLTACKALTPEEFAAPRTSFFPSLRATLNHILWVDLYYIDALHREPTVLQRYDDPVPDFPDAASLYDAQIASDRRLVAFCERQTEESLAEGLSLPRPNRTPPPSSVISILEPSLPAPNPSPRPGACDAGRHEGEATAARRVLPGWRAASAPRRAAGAGARAELMRPRSSFAGAAIEVSDLARSRGVPSPVAADAGLPSRLDQSRPGDVVARLRPFRDAPGQGRYLLRAGVRCGSRCRPRVVARSTRCSPSCATLARRSSSRRRNSIISPPAIIRWDSAIPTACPSRSCTAGTTCPTFPMPSRCAYPATASAWEAISSSRWPASRPIRR